MRGESEEVEPGARKPILGDFLRLLRLGYHPRASNTTAARIDGTAALFIAHLVLETITRTRIPKTIIQSGFLANSTRTPLRCQSNVAQCQDKHRLRDYFA